eukprot:scaffold122618_cov18-Tisochrysis_lutea.AAC.1
MATVMLVGHHHSNRLHSCYQGPRWRVSNLCVKTVLMQDVRPASPCTGAASVTNVGNLPAWPITTIIDLAFPVSVLDVGMPGRYTG